MQNPPKNARLIRFEGKASILLAALPFLSLFCLSHGVLF